jgi:hypothetical protein
MGSYTMHVLFNEWPFYLAMAILTRIGLAPELQGQRV